MNAGKKIRNIFLTLAGIAIFAAVYAYIGFEKIASVMYERLTLAVVASALLLTLLNIIIRAYRWGIILRSLHTCRVEFWPLLSYTFTGGFLANITPGKLGELGKSYFLKRTHGIGLRHGLPSVVLEKLSDIIITVGIAVFFVCSFVYNLGLPAIIIFLISYVLLVAIGFLLAKAFSRKILNIGFISRFMQKKGVEDSEIYNIFGKISSASFVLKAFALTAVIWLIGALRLWLIGNALGLNISFPYYLAIISISLFIGGLFLIPSGIGVNDAVMIALFNMMGGSLELYGAATLANTVLSVVFVNVVGGILLIIFFGKAGKRGSKGLNISLDYYEKL